ncbi:28629_t:CDS:2 [Gigaspora margarita]|uniref:28629_t:CDS:1 n=1 Tax=Gigaspora margarita TaxID=4874 RepID=A0ABM8VXN1_GIGMA|nr:28629_t:CDS:2 [Gigaspora margarita]
MGKAEGRGKEWHGHVTAITVASEYRRIGLADGMMKLLESVSDKIYNGYFVDLFVRVSNTVAIGMYKKFGYSVYRRVIGYYSSGDNNEEDAFDMRKPLPRDVNKESIIENGEHNLDAAIVDAAVVDAAVVNAAVVDAAVVDAAVVVGAVVGFMVVVVKTIGLGDVTI